jgi:hypothetical protein
MMAFRGGPAWAQRAASPRARAEINPIMTENETALISNLPRMTLFLVIDAAFVALLPRQLTRRLVDARVVGHVIFINGNANISALALVAPTYGSTQPFALGLG